jgi:hypothetical protein
VSEETRSPDTATSDAPLDYFSTRSRMRPQCEWLRGGVCGRLLGSANLKHVEPSASWRSTC